MDVATIIPGVQTIMRERLTHDPRLQFRASLDMGRIADFASEMQDGTRFEPVVAFYDGTTTWLADGYHRDAAADSLDWHTIECDVREGSFLDALFYAFRVNAAPGHKQLTARERREGIWRLIDEAPSLPNGAIAEKAGVDHSTVARARAAKPVSFADAKDSPVTRTVTRNGTTYQQDVSRIGRRPRVEDDDPDMFSGVSDADDGDDTDDDALVDDPIARASQLAREHPSVKWPEAMERLYKFMIGARNAGGFAEMIRDWRPEYRESSKRELDRVIHELTIWRTLLEEAR